MTQDTNVIKANVGQVFILKGGEIKDPLRMADFHPLSNTSGLLVHIEDAGGLQSIGKINFAPQLRGNNNVAYHWYPMYFRGFVEKIVSSESAPRTFAQYFVHVPAQVLAMNANKKTPMDVALTTLIQGGINYLGNFDRLTDLNTEYPATEDLSNTLVIGYVWEIANRGFYQVEWNASISQYEWKKISDGQAYVRLQQKQYNLSYMTIQGGYAPQIEKQALKDPQFEALMLEIQDINSRLYQYSVDFYDLELRVLALENRNVFTNEEKTKVSKIIIDGGGIQALFDDGDYKEVPLISTFNLLAGRVTDVENDKVNKSGDKMSGNLDMDGNKIKNAKLNNITLGDIADGVADGDAVNVRQLNKKANKSTKIAGMDLSEDRSADDVVEALRVATTLLKGLMSANDKSKLDDLPTNTDLINAFEGKVDKEGTKQLSDENFTSILKQDLETLIDLYEADEDGFINKIEELLEIFATYPEGADILELISGKVTKNEPIIAGTNPKITYDKNGLVTGGEALTESDIPELSQSKIAGLVTALASFLKKDGSVKMTGNLDLGGDEMMGVEKRCLIFNKNNKICFDYDTEILSIIANSQGEFEETYEEIKLTATWLDLGERLLKNLAIEYDNNESGLEAGNIQEAIDELVELILAIDITNFITKDANNLTNYYDKTTSDSKYLQSHQSLENYYKKSETYSQTEINNLISQIPKFKIITVDDDDSLPTEEIDLMAIYVSLDSGKEFIYLADKSRWEELGTLAPNLAGYATEAWVNGKGYLTDIPQANENTLGGVKGGAKTAGDTVEVKIDNSTAKMYVPTYPDAPTIPDLEINNGGAESGKYISQVAVDATNKHKVNVTKANLPTVPTDINELADSNNMLGDKNVQADWEQTDTGADDYIKGKPTIPTKTSDITNDSGYITSGALSGLATEEYVNGKVASTYKASGSLTSAGIVSGLLIKANLGNVYNISENFTTTTDFLEGMGHAHPAGTNIVIIDSGSEVYKFDVLAGFVDLSSYVKDNDARLSDARTPTAHSTDLLTSGTLGVARGGTGRTDGYAVGVVETRASVLTKIWTGTEAQYDAIGTKDANTLYFII